MSLKIHSGSQIQRLHRFPKKQTLGQIDLQIRNFVMGIIGFTRRKPKVVSKIINYSFRWAVYFNPSHPNAPWQKELSHSLSLFQNALAVREVPQFLPRVIATVLKAFKTPTVANARNAWKTFSIAFGTTYSGFSFINHCIPLIEEEGMRKFGILSYLTLVGGTLNGAIQSAQNIHAMKNRHPNQVIFQTLNIARDTSFFSLGVLRLLSLLGKASIPPWASLSATTLGLFYSLQGQLWNETVLKGACPEDRVLKRCSIRV